MPKCRLLLLSCNWTLRPTIYLFDYLAISILTTQNANCLPICLTACSLNSGTNWCDLDSGYTTFEDDIGHVHRVYVSLTRDGSVWLRFGKDHQSQDWIFEDEQRFRLQGFLLEPEAVNLIRYVNYTAFCVLTDLNLRVKAVSSWQPTYLVVLDPTTKSTDVVLMKYHPECHSETVFSLTLDKQGLACEGATKNVCGQRFLPERGQRSPTYFVKDVNFDPRGTDHWLCNQTADTLSTYTFRGTYYHAFVRVATCNAPKS